MRKLVMLTAVVSVGLAAVGCTGFRAPVVPPYGWAFTQYTAPLTSELAGQSVPPKRGEASSAAVLGLVGWGDCGLEAAAKDGGLATIQYCDYSVLNVLGVYTSFTVIAYGN